MADPRHSMKQAAIQQAKREGRAWVLALAIIIVYFGVKAWLG